MAAAYTTLVYGGTLTAGDNLLQVVQPGTRLVVRDITLYTPASSGTTVNIYASVPGESRSWQLLVQHLDYGGYFHLGLRQALHVGWELHAYTDYPANLAITAYLLSDP
jgi:hypothetical protein